MNRIICLTVLVWLISCSGGQTQNGSPTSSLNVLYPKEVISTGGNFALKQAYAELQVAVLTPRELGSLLENDDVAQDFVLDLHSNAALAQRALDEGLNNRPDVAARLQNAKHAILVEAVIRQAQTEAVAALTSSERNELAEEYYLAHPKEFTEPEKRYVRHILIASAPTCRCDTRDVNARLDGALEELAQGQAFTDVAEKYSNDKRSFSTGGELPVPVTQGGKYLAEFTDGVFELEAEGDISDPIKTKHGFHIVQLDRIEREKLLPFDEVRDFASQKAMDRLVVDVAQALRGEAYPLPAEINLKALRELAEKALSED